MDATGRMIKNLPLLLIVAVNTAWANEEFETLVSFNGTNGVGPAAGLLQANDGNFYGTTYSDGREGEYGTVFKMTPSGVLTTLVFFNKTNGANPLGRLVQAKDGNFYGTTYAGGTNDYAFGGSGSGTVFKMTPSGVLTTLVSFNGTNGTYPMAGLVEGNDGNFYGTTQIGGTNGGYGTVFKMTPSGALTTLVSFNNTNGAFPQGGLIQAIDGNFYGTTAAGGDNFQSFTNYHAGTVFRLTTSGVLTTLVSFNGTNGGSPEAGLTEMSDGNFYGTTTAGGTNKPSIFGNNNGTVFKMTPSGALTNLFSFKAPDAYFPVAGVTEGSDGNLYGTTLNGSYTVFRMTPAGIVTAFGGANNINIESELIQANDGNFYGTSFDGGESNQGTVFKITPHFPAVLRVRRTTSNIVVSWPASSTNFQLETSSDLLLNGGWGSVAMPAVTNKGTVTVTFPPSSATNQFYRLKGS
jgi:uncharacterized repeat protein (TIGR03803 family)